MKILFIILFSMVFSVLFLSLGSANKLIAPSINVDTLKAQIEITILSNGVERYARVYDKVKAGDKFQIHIKGEANYFVWIIYSNKKSTYVLSDTTIKAGIFITLPLSNKYYEFDGNDPQENLFVFLAVNHLVQKSFNKLINQDLLKYIKEKSEQSKCNICESGEPLININGNLRAVTLNDHQLTKYLGINYLIKEYQFNVKK